jgi:hypothetical protein
LPTVPRASGSLCSAALVPPARSRFLPHVHAPHAVHVNRVCAYSCNPPYDTLLTSTTGCCGSAKSIPQFPSVTCTIIRHTHTKLVRRPVQTMQTGNGRFCHKGAAQMNQQCRGRAWPSTSDAQGTTAVRQQYRTAQQLAAQSAGTNNSQSQSIGPGRPFVASGQKGSQWLCPNKPFNTSQDTNLLGLEARAQDHQNTCQRYALTPHSNRLRGEEVESAQYVPLSRSIAAYMLSSAVMVTWPDVRHAATSHSWNLPYIPEQ